MVKLNLVKTQFCHRWGSKFKKSLMTENEKLLNKIAQNLLTLENGIKVYDTSHPQEKTELFNNIILCMFQACPNKESIEKGIENSGIKKTMTPSVIFLKNTLNNAKRKIQQLEPELEKRKAFIIMLSIFKEADTIRRNTKCIDGCLHYWHNIKWE